MDSVAIDALWDFSDPAGSRDRFEAARHGQPDSVQAEILTQIARCNGLLGDFAAGDAALDDSDRRSGGVGIASARSLLERGRLRRTSGSCGAEEHFREAESRAHAGGWLYYEIDAIHMRALVEPEIEELSARGLALASGSADRRCHRWRVALNNNLGWHFVDSGHPDIALPYFRSALEAATESGEKSRIDTARWCVAHVLRLNQDLDGAGAILSDLTQSPDAAAMVYGELAELELARDRYPAARAAAQEALRRGSTDARVITCAEASDADLRYRRYVDRMYNRAEESDVTNFDYDGPYVTEDEFHADTIRSWVDPEVRAAYSGEQIGQAVWEQLHEIGWVEETFAAAAVLFRETLEPRATDSLAHLNEPVGNLDGTVYMFWDIAGWHPNFSRATPEQRQRFLAICQNCLASDRAAIQESALHGLGHAAMYLEGAEAMIDEWLRTGTPVREELVEYARAAQRGMVQ